MRRLVLNGICGWGSRSLGRMGLSILVAGGLAVIPLVHLVHAAAPQSSSLPGASAPSTIMTVRFAPGSSVLPAAIEPTLSRIAADLLAAPGVRIALIGYPNKAQDFVEKDRSHRLSLTRAIVLRRRLIDMGVPQVRMIVRLVALHDSHGQHSDRVDIVKMSGDG